jgi:LytS/YehU family sensor histidine kinase
MFNTLNNVYALSLDKSEKTSELILRFSNLLSYTLYECKDESVLLSKELEFISNYVELEKIRLDDEISISVVVNGHPGTRKIAPLIFLPLIENAFKHGVNLRPKKTFVSIQIDISEEKLLQFKIENNFEPNEADSKGKNGIGLINVRKRLDLLYQSQHKLKIYKTEETYKVELEIYFT